MKVKIYQPPKSTMQSGRARVSPWQIEYELETPRYPEPLMGWTASADTLNEVKLHFQTLEEAKAFAEKNGWDYTVAPAHERHLRPRNYIDNFRYKAPPPRDAN
jgi:hypothetical protein